MIAQVLRRVGLTLPTLLGVSLVVFITIKIVPGDPVSVLLGPQSSPEARDALQERLGLNDPLPLQYISWLRHTLAGDFGTSIARRTEVAPLVFDALVNTLIIAGIAALIALVLGISIGWITAVRDTGVAAWVGNTIALVAISLPQYSVGLFFIIFLAAGAGWFPVSGMRDPMGNGGFLDLLHHAALPAITAALVPAGVIARMFRSSLRDVLSMDFIEALNSRGFDRRRVMRHAFHNTVPSLLTVAGLQIGYLLGGVILVEVVFSWPGLGLMIYQSISQRDLPVIQAGVLLSALAFVLINLAVDIATAVVDPRVRT